MLSCFCRVPYVLKDRNDLNSECICYYYIPFYSRFRHFSNGNLGVLPYQCPALNIEQEKYLVGHLEHEPSQHPLCGGEANKTWTTCFSEKWAFLMGCNDTDANLDVLHLAMISHHFVFPMIALLAVNALHHTFY